MRSKRHCKKNKYHRWESKLKRREVRDTCKEIIDCYSYDKETNIFNVVGVDQEDYPWWRIDNNKHILHI